jgi:alpha-maltose-1-phosphate synthase
MNRLIAININLSTSGRRLGGAAIASEFHSYYISKHFPVELWRMWDADNVHMIGTLKVRDFTSKTNFSRFEKRLPRRIRSCFLDSNILNEILVLNPGVIHLHNPLPSFAFERLARWASSAGIKVVATSHGFFEVMFPNYDLKSYEKWLWRQTVTNPVMRAFAHMDALLTLYPEERELLRRCGVPDEKIHLVPNGVNPYFLEPPPSEVYNDVCKKFGIDRQQPILLFIGNHTANKGLDTVMRVAHELSTKATIVVGGKLRSPDEPQQWQARLSVNPAVKVIFTDFLSVEEQRTLYYLSTLLLYPSLADTLPLTIIEAMASGLPVVAYDVGGITYQLAEDAGIVVPSGEFPQFLAAVQTLLEQPDRRTQLAHNAKQRQQQYFSWDITAQRTIAIYRQLLGQ